MSFMARLVGERAIRNAEVSENPDTPGDYSVDFVPPPVNGAYQLTVSVRWWRGMEDPGENNTSTFLGANGYKNFKQDDRFRQVEEACVVFGSPVAVYVEGAVAKPTAELPICSGMNEQGCWEKVNGTALCNHPSPESLGECYVLDRVNPDWLWRGDECRYHFFSQMEVQRCFNHTTLLVRGDSLADEIAYNLLGFGMEDLLDRTLYRHYRAPYFGRLSDWKRLQTKRVFLIVNFDVTHLIFHRPLNFLSNNTVDYIKASWAQILEVAPDFDIHVIFYSGYPAHFEREKGITHDRMVHANGVLATAAKDLGFEIMDTNIVLSSRPEASWDGLHFSFREEHLGGVSKMLTMILLNRICSSEIENDRLVLGSDKEFT